MAIAMLTAAQLGFKMEEVQAAFALVDPSVQPADEPMPDFLDEWYQPDMISLTRFQNCGNTDYRASSAFEGIFGVGTMQQGMISVLDRQSDRDEVVELTGKLWAQVTAEADVTQYAQAEGERGAVTFTIAGRAHGPFKMRGRLVVRELSLRTWTCLNFLPAPEQRSLTAPAGGFVASVSLQSSPLPSPTLPHSLQPSLLPAPPPAAAAAASAEPTRAGESAAPGPEQVLTPLTAAAAEDGINDSMGVFNASELVALFMDEGEVDALFNGGVPLGEADGSALTLLGVLGRR
ncbi:hypothetical protein T492DRAFT_846479 [Pavlovales sp. CCMP2436]|nr:hypothetical protein T492DRAFT_846479 [Pavlovales sp. CCMP2436]